MARRKTRSPSERSAAPPARKAPPEDRRSEAITVAWMLAAVATLAAQLVALAARLVAGSAAVGRAPPVAAILPGWFLICATFTGVVCLVLTPFVYRLRRTPPPWPVTAGAVVISLTPLAAILVLSR